jgi:hypothetical protein
MIEVGYIRQFLDINATIAPVMASVRHHYSEVPHPSYIPTCRMRGNGAARYLSFNLGVYTA